ncbi:MAG: glycosyltransferase [Cetobacterium sp.]
MDYKFSVLISVYFKEVPQYLEVALKSITDDQTLKPNQIVLVKDGPLTKELDMVVDRYVEKYSDLFKIVSLEKNSGLGKALNIGLENCDYELVARMDGDDISKPERFKEQIEMFKKNPELDMIGSWIDEFEIKNGEFKIRSIRNVPETNDEIHQKLKTICAFNHPTVMYKKSKVIEAGSYLQEFALEDYYLWVRLALNNCKFYNLQKSLLYFRVTEGTSKRRGGIKLLKNDLQFQKKIYLENFTNRLEYSKNICKYSFYRVIPFTLRNFLQKKIYRRRKDDIGCNSYV